MMHVCTCGHNRFEHFGRDGYCQSKVLLNVCECLRYRFDKLRSEKATRILKTIKRITGVSL